MTTGELGLGKIISPNTSVVSDCLMEGEASSNGKNSAMAWEKETVVPWWEYSGPAP